MSRPWGEVCREGFGLHTGRHSRIVLRARPGPLAIRLAVAEVPLSFARVAGTEGATTLEIGGVRVSTVEHLLAAFGGLGVRAGLCIEVEGLELPLLDGGARAWADAILELGLWGNDGPELEVVRAEELRVGSSVYAFEPAEGVRVEATIDFGDDRLAPSACWDGDSADFLQRIATARTFAFESELRAEAARGGVAHVDPGSVVILSRHDVLSTGRPFLPDEPARHKVLDLVGDLFLHGGPPRGTVRAHRPGHGATHAAMGEALERGIVRRSEDAIVRAG